MLREELDVYVNDEIFWTDSQVVLAYINSDVRRFKVFAANRVLQIHDHTNECSNNPANEMILFVA